MLISNIKKNYSEFSTVVLYRREFNASPPTCVVHLSVNCQICYKRGNLKTIDEMSEDELKKYYSRRKSSTRRAKTSVTDYALCNKFSQFITLTFNPDLVDSFDYDTSKRLVSKWINNQRRHSPKLTYILVAEKHKSGRIHFHMIVNNFNGKLVKAVNPKTGRSLIKNGKQIYNLSGWKYGFSTLSNIENQEATARYLQKYLTKDFIEAFNKKRFWTSRGLNKPTKEYNIDFVSDNYLPMFTKVFKTDNYYKYTLLYGQNRIQELQIFERSKAFKKSLQHDTINIH